MKIFDQSKMSAMGRIRDGAFQFTPQGYEAFWGAVQAHFDKPLRDARTLTKKFAELATISQFPDQVSQLFEKFKVGTGEVDMSWLSVFDALDLSNSTLSSFDIVDVKNGLSFKKVLPGEKALIYGLTGVSESVRFDQYGAGLQIPGVWYEDQRWWDIEEAVQDYNLAWWERLAEVFFALIEAATDGIFGGTVDGVNIAYDAVGSTTLEKDVNTINAGVMSLFDGLKAAGMRTGSATPLVLICNLSRRDRCAAALEARRGVVYSGPETLIREIRLVTTLGLTTSNTWNSNGAGTEHTADELPLGYLAVPGRKCKYLNRRPLRVYPPRFDEQIYATSVFAWGRYGGVLNEAQVRRLLASAGS
ncbi:MAG TPA: hypothetical protein VMX13_14105 [Sedimentisphaerales bacterium]|nr:hypothetical protein [Sedimentisphaerales bacterium]